MPRERTAWIRFVIVVVAAAVGETSGIWLRLPSSDILLPVLFGSAAYYLTMGLNTPRFGRNANVRYWRGRRIDDN